MSEHVVTSDTADTKKEWAKSWGFQRKDKIWTSIFYCDTNIAGYDAVYYCP
jgi:hypothetical protein